MFIYNCLYVLHISKLTIIQKQTKKESRFCPLAFSGGRAPTWRKRVSQCARAGVKLESHPAATSEGKWFHCG